MRAIEEAFGELLAEHKRIRTLLRSARDGDVPWKERRRRARALIELVHRHAHAEEASLYCVLLARRTETHRVLGGQEEHELFENEASRLARTMDEELWEARLKVLGDVLERHLEQEESALLPLAASALSEEDIHLIREEYLRVMAGLKNSRGPLVAGRVVEPGPQIEMDGHHPMLPVEERPSWGN